MSSKISLNGPIVELPQGSPPCYTEISQHCSIRMAPISTFHHAHIEEHIEAIKLMWYPVSCRDKMQDLPILLRMRRGIATEIHGFSYENDNELANQSRKLVRLLLTFTDKNEAESFYKYLPTLNDEEVKMGFIPTSILLSWNKRLINAYRWDEHNYNIVIQTDIKWAESLWLWSLYTLILRNIASVITLRDMPQSRTKDGHIYERSQITNLDDLTHFVANAMCSMELNGSGTIKYFSQSYSRYIAPISFLLANHTIISGDSPLSGANDLLWMKAWNFLFCLPYKNLMAYKNFAMSPEEQEDLLSKYGTIKANSTLVGVDKKLFKPKGNSYIGQISRSYQHSSKGVTSLLEEISNLKMNIPTDYSSEDLLIYHLHEVLTSGVSGVWVLNFLSLFKSSNNGLKQGDEFKEFYNLLIK